ncbi:aldolase [Cristinia sonorae]|uniref:Aldolase n=1 Tax=Cristinia sonorae TaxID=1940300 RepID=A0A8K0XRQ2_9AGAR|nr:aldolase [Cristinia sonorae]
MSSPTLLTQLRDRVVVDVDSMDPAVAEKYSQYARFCDMTSNQAIAFSEASKPGRVAVVKAACVQAKARLPTSGIEEQVTLALDILTAYLAKDVIPYLEKRVHAQTSPSVAHNTEKTIAHATRLVEQFEAVGIPRSRVCIKIPLTPESVVACHALQNAGINTLGTCLFNLPQALAASQAGCLYVAPYFNGAAFVFFTSTNLVIWLWLGIAELRVHFQPDTWVEYKNTVEEHPTIAVIDSVMKAFKAIDSPTLVMPASIVTVSEILALAALHPHHLTISANILNQLASDTTTQLDSVKAPTSEQSLNNSTLGLLKHLSYFCCNH